MDKNLKGFLDGVKGLEQLTKDLQAKITPDVRAKMNDNQIEMLESMKNGFNLDGKDLSSKINELQNTLKKNGY